MSHNISPDSWMERVDEHQQMLVNRLRKRERHLRKWARREGVSAYRLYDGDIPEVPLYIDRYNEYYVVSWLIPRALRDWEEHPWDHPWLAAMVSALCSAMDTDDAHVYVRARRPTRGQVQYDRVARKETNIWVEEHGLSFRVNLSDYVDTGLFLDHRPSRARVREVASGKRVLNLFGYTGAFAVHAAAGGAQSVVTLDLSTHYTTWARENLDRNGFTDTGRYRTDAVDVMDWLQKDALQDAGYDVIILDPPTTSRSKRMRGTLDVQRDHTWLIDRCVRLLNPGGSLLFSTNYRRFRPDAEAFECVQKAEEITAWSVPEDFPRSRPHRAWWLTL